MASGQQLAETNVVLFYQWVAAQTDADFREMTTRGQLSRTEIAKQVGFAKSVLAQNPKVKAALGALEAQLRDRGVLPASAANGPNQTLEQQKRAGQGGSTSPSDLERLRRLEQENALLRAEVVELKALLAKHSVLSEALALTGRMPR